MKTIAILITVHNRREKTLECLANLEKQKIPLDVSFEVYLTDDGCNDGTREAVVSQYPRVHIIDGDGNLFWNRGMLAAWRVASLNNYDFYLWLNDDTVIYENVLASLIECSEKHLHKAIIIGSTCALNHPEEITYGGWVNGKINTCINQEIACDTFNGNIVLVPRFVYETLGTNDPYYRHALGDIDYGLRARKSGIELWTVPGVMGVCDRHESLTIWMDPSQPLKRRWRNFLSPLGNNPFEFFYFRKKHYGFIAACKSFITNFIHFLFPGLWIKAGKELYG